MASIWKNVSLSRPIVKSDDEDEVHTVAQELDFASVINCCPGKLLTKGPTGRLLPAPRPSLREQADDLFARVRQRIRMSDIGCPLVSIEKDRFPKSFVALVNHRPSITAPFPPHLKTTLSFSPAFPLPNLPVFFERLVF